MEYLELKGIAKYNRFMYLKDINDFPCVLLLSKKQEIHTEGQLVLETQEIRGYTLNEDPNVLAQKIEDSISDKRVKVTTVTTDEGVLSPYGMTDLTIEILNEIKNT